MSALNELVKVALVFEVGRALGYLTVLIAGWLS